MVKFKKLYHISDVNHNGEIFLPRIPETIIMGQYSEDLEMEEMLTKRVCFSKTISGAFLAINFDGSYEELYLHVPENINDISKEDIIIPTEEQVWDGEYTKEVWVTAPVKMKCIGKVRIGYNLSKMTWRDWRPSVKFKWIEKYD
jgi:hypothetical protein